MLFIDELLLVSIKYVYNDLHKMLNCFSIKIQHITQATIMNTHTEIHQMAGRALPIQMCMYRHAVVCYKLVNEVFCDNEFMHLNF